jgi:hypothetical protein
MRAATRAGSSFTTERSACTGRMALTPSSVALRTTQSMRSLRQTPCSSTSSSGDSRSAARGARTTSSIARLSTSATSAANSKPLPSNNTTASPGRARSTRPR